MKKLSPIEEKEIKYKKVMGFDIETCDDNKTFLLACFYSKDVRQTVHSVDEAIEFISRHMLRDYVIFATNLAFDFLGLFFDYKDRWSVSERNGTIYGFTWYQSTRDEVYNKNPIKFYDTMNIFPRSVEELGHMIDIQKLKHPDFFPNKPKNVKEWQDLRVYCMRDAEISCRFVEEIVYPFLKKYNIPLKSTIGAESLHIFRRHHLKDTFFQESEDKRIIARASYYGGRTEVFKRGSFGRTTCYDINSLYPSAMCYPVPNTNKSRIVEKSGLRLINKYEGVSYVKINIPDMKIPPLPYKHEGRLIFPVGIIEGYWTHIELRNALKYGCEILEYGSGIYYKETVDLFSGFVKTHYGERLILKKEGNPLEQMEKAVLNNLYGKFAFNYTSCSSIIPSERFDPTKLKEGDEVIPLFDNKFFSVTTEIPPPIYSFPIWSSYITARARLIMYGYLSDKRLKDKILYTDTDSIFLENDSGEIQHSDKLGEMGLEKGYPVERSVFIRPKMYYTHKLKCKGIKTFYDEKDHSEQIYYKILHKQKIIQDRFTKFRTAIRSKEEHKWGVLKPNQIIKVEKTLDLEDTKRAWKKFFDADEYQDSRPLKFINGIPRNPYDKDVVWDTSFKFC